MIDLDMLSSRSTSTRPAMLCAGASPLPYCVFLASPVIAFSCSSRARLFSLRSRPRVTSSAGSRSAKRNLHPFSMAKQRAKSATIEPTSFTLN